MNKNIDINSANESIQEYTRFLKETRSFLELVKDLTKGFEDLNVSLTKENQDRLDKEVNQAKESLYVLTLCNIFTLDIIVSIKHLLLSETDWEKIYFSKKICTTIHETINTYDSYNTSLHRDAINTNNLAQLKSFSDKLKVFKKKYEKILEKTRNKSDAHIDPDFIIYYDSIMELKTISIDNMANEFIVIISELTKVVHSVNNKTKEDLLIKTDKLIDSLNEKTREIESALKEPNENSNGNYYNETLTKLAELISKVNNKPKADD